MNGETAPSWPLWQRLLFRWWFAYIVLFAFPFPLYYLPFTLPLEWIDNGQTALATAVGHALFGVAEVPVSLQTGSGDTLLAWLVTFTNLLLATVIAAVWSVVARRSGGHPKLHSWLRPYVRYLLFAALVSYGFAKIIPTQFPPPTAIRLSERVGDLSPMGLLWTFMGYSVPYNVFAGVMEAGSGVLLLFRRTTLLGALLALGVLGNVVMLNMAYDVPVKLYSMHLWLMTAWLALPDTGRLTKLLLLNEPVPAADLAPLISARWFVWPRVVVKLWACWTLWGVVQGQLPYLSEIRAATTSTTGVYGAWNVSGFVLSGNEVDGPASTVTAWRTFGANQLNDRGFIRFANDSLIHIAVEVDSVLERIAVYPIDSLLHRDSTHATILRLAAQGGDSLVLEGSHRGDSLHMVFTRIDRSSAPLLRRGFRWVQEYPYNR